MENCVEDTLIAISNISDNGYVFEVKKAYAPEMLTAFIKVNGATVGVVANRTKVYDDDMNVAAEYEAKQLVDVRRLQNLLNFAMHSELQF